jgi:hypothetical protein
MGGVTKRAIREFHAAVMMANPEQGETNTHPSDDKSTDVRASFMETTTATDVL